MTIHNSLAELIGNTPLVKLNHIPQVAGVKSTIAVKVEYFNPGGTISGTGKYLKEASNGAVKVIGSDPEGSIYSASSRDEVHQYDIEGVGGGRTSTPRPSTGTSPTTSCAYPTPKPLK